MTTESESSSNASLMMSYADARDENVAIRNLSTVLKQVGLSDEGEELWKSITESMYTAGNELGAQVNLWCPVDAMPLVRAKSMVAAGFALACIGEQLLEMTVAQKKPIPLADPAESMAIAKKGWEKFEERRVLAETLKGGLGCSLDASWEHARQVQSIKDESKLDDVRKIAEVAGRMYAALQEVGPTIEVNGQGEVKQVITGGDIERVIPEDLAKIVEEGALGDMASVDLLEGKTREYEQKQTVPGQRGPLVILRDESGSMDNDYTGDSRNTWASAAAVALARTAHDSGRVATVVHYGTAVAISDLMPGDSQALLNMAAHFMNGGTAIGDAMKAGIKQVKKLAERGQAGADMVLVTDGEDPDLKTITDALDEMALLGIDLYLVLIECKLDPSNPLVARAKQVVEVGDPSNVNVVTQLQGATQNVAPTGPIGIGSALAAFDGAPDDGKWKLN